MQTFTKRKHSHYEIPVSIGLGTTIIKMYNKNGSISNKTKPTSLENMSQCY